MKKLPIDWNGAHIIVVSGYAQSGKSTFIKHMQEKYGFYKVSSSDALHEFVQLLWINLFTKDVDTYTFKNICIKMSFSIDKLVTWAHQKMGRDILIDIAENCLKPVFGKDIFVNYQIKKTNLLLSEGKKVIIESIGGDEFDLLMNKVNFTWACYPNAVKFVNVRSKFENPGADGRTLIKGKGAIQIWDTEIQQI